MTERIRNTYGLTKKVIYENEEFHLLQAALNIEDGIEQEQDKEAGTAH